MVYDQRRYFNITDKGEEAVNTNFITQLAGQFSTIMVAIDIDEDGRLDILI